MGNLLTCYKFDKRLNSIKLPENGGEVTISGNVALKEDTSLETPVFVMAIGAGDMPALWKSNYAKFLDTYYWITDKVYRSNAHVEIHCTIDPLASLHDKILTTEAFVVYDEAANSEIPDNRLSRNTSATTAFATAASPLPYYKTGMCVLTAVGKSSTGVFVGTPAQMDVLLNSFDNWYEEALRKYPAPEVEVPYPGDIPGNIEALMRNLGSWFNWIGNRLGLIMKQFMNVGNVYDNIKSCTWMPINLIGIVGMSGTNLFLGDFDTQVTLMKATEQVGNKGVDVAIPWQVSDWRRRSPYHEILLYLPYIGQVTISPDEYVNATAFHINYYFNIVAGTVSASVSAGGHPVGRFSANVGAPYPLGSSNINPAQAAGTAIATLSSVATGLATASALSSIGSPFAGAATVGAIAGTGSGALNVMNELVPTGNIVSTGGGGTPDELQVVCTTIFHDTNVSPSSISSVCGTPTLAKKTLGSLSGYVQTSGASVHADTECIEVVTRANALLDGGVFIE